METRLGTVLAVALLVSSAFAGCIGSGDGSTQDQTGSSTPPSGGNQAPTSFFTFSCHHLQCTFDGGRSDDADGEITSYEWDFDDGTTGEGEIVDHSFSEGGEYTVTLTVRDTNGATDSSKRQVPVSQAPPGHTHGGGDDDDPDPEPNELPDDYHARHEGPVTPTFDANWTFPVKDSRASLASVQFNVTSDTLPAGIAHNVTVDLLDPDGDLVASGTVNTTSPEVRWNVTEGVGQVGTWTVDAQGQGAGDDELGGTSYVLLVDVYYGTAP
jgi:PKD repeat protein